MTASVVLPLGLEEFEFDIPCEWEDSPCNGDAAVMCKGCDDDEPRALCMDHYTALRLWFDEQKPAICICGRPFIHFSTHYDTLSL